MYSFCLDDTVEDSSNVLNHGGKRWKTFRKRTLGNKKNLFIIIMFAIKSILGCLH